MFDCRMENFLPDNFFLIQQQYLLQFYFCSVAVKKNVSFAHSFL